MEQIEYRKHIENLSFYVCVKDTPRSGESYGPSVRNVYVLECCTGGEGSVIINGKVFPITTGDCYLLLPGDRVTHTADTQNPRRGYSCVFGGLSVNRAISSAGFSSEKPYAPKAVFGEILEQMKLLEQMSQDTDMGAEFRRAACVNCILGILLRNTPNTKQNAWVDRVLGLIEARYDQPITVQSLASELSLERNYFTSLFKAKTGSTPSDYLTSVRIKKACILLKETSEPVAAVAAAVGLDARNFARIFKKVVGQTPRQYKAEQEKEYKK